LAAAATSIVVGLSSSTVAYGLEGNTRRAIDFPEGDKIDEEALKAPVRAAVRLNTSRARR
jgi:hypothetical protein